MGTVLASVRIVPRPGQEEETLRAVRAVVASAKALPGCTSGDILREIAPPWGLTYAAIWVDAQRLAQYLVSDDFDLMLKLLEASAEPPTVSFRFVSETRDLTWVERLRFGGDTPTAACVRHPKVAELAHRRHAARPRHGDR